MVYKYFVGCINIESVKSEYRTLVKKYHPDVNPGIDVNEIKNLNIEYEYINKSNGVGGIKFPIENPTYNFNPRNQSSQDAFRDNLKKEREAREAKERASQFRNASFTNGGFKQSTSEFNPLDNSNEAINFICRTYVDIKLKGHQPSSLVFKYTDYKTRQGKKLNLDELKFIGKILEYKDGWANIYYEKVTYQKA